MTNGTVSRDALIERHTNVAEIVACRFLASHSDVDGDEVRQDAYLAMIRAVDDFTDSESKPIGIFIYQRVNDALLIGYRKLVRRARIAPMESLGVIGLSDGEPLHSIRDLRAASSLNPRADCNNGMREGLGQVRSASHVQNSPGKVFRSSALPSSRDYYPVKNGSASDKRFYDHQAAKSRERVADITQRFEAMRVRRNARAAENTAA